MVWRRGVALAALVLGTLAPAPAGAGAGETPTCMFAAPAKISISHEDMELTPSFSGTCREAAAGYAYWTLPTADHGGNAAVAGFDLFTDAYLSVYDSVQLGAVTWHPVQAGTGRNTEPCSPGQTQDCDTDLTMYQNQPVTMIRLGAAPRLTGSRSGTTVTLSVKSTVWSPSAHTFVARSAHGVLQVHDAGGTWRELGNPFATATDGRRTVTITTPAPRTFRYAMYLTPTSWRAVSTAITR